MNTATVTVLRYKVLPSKQLQILRPHRFVASGAYGPQVGYFHGSSVVSAGDMAAFVAEDIDPGLTHVTFTLKLASDILVPDGHPDRFRNRFFRYGRHAPNESFYYNHDNLSCYSALGISFSM